MWTAILGWTSLVLSMGGVAVIVFGYLDMGRQTVADAQMGGAILAMLGMVFAGLGVVLGIIWLAVT